MDIDKTAGNYDLLSVGTTLTYGGTLIVSNLSAAFASGDSFQLFSAGSYSGAFAAISPATPGVGLLWDTNSLTTSGTLNVIPAVNTNPTNITTSVSGNVLTLSWPADHTGWRLIVQTNNLAAGISLNTNDMDDRARLG